MSLRPAQEFVEGSSTFSLRHFFEQQQQQQPQQPQMQPQMQAQQHSPPQSLPIRSPAELSLSAMDGMHPFHAHAPSEQPFARSHMPTPLAMPTAATAHPRESKFTFTGLMPLTTPIQMQHKILQQHQQQALGQGAALAKPTALSVDSANEVLRLKAQVVQLSEKLAQASANLATTSESVVRGNKALTSERAQFHSKYASLSKKLETTQAALSEAEAFPKEDVMNAKLLNAKVLELQTENERLAATHAELEVSLSKAEATAAETAQALALAASETSTTATAAAADAAVPTAEEEERQAQQRADLADLREKFTSLSAQHSSLIDARMQLEESLKGKEEDLLAVEEELGAAIERAEEAELEVVELRDQAEISKREIAQTDSLVDVLDERLADARSEAATEAVAEAEAEAMVGMAEEEVLEEACCCPETMRCEELERDAQHARNMINGARQEEHKQRYEEWQFAASLARRARHALTTGNPERIVVAHVHAGNVAAPLDDEPRFDLSEHVGVHPRRMGESLDDSCLHCAVDIGAGAERDTTTASGRTNAFVQAVSKDLKLSMDGSQALYASSSTTGVALRI